METYKPSPLEIQFESATMEAWNHMQWGEVGKEEDRIYPIMGHEVELRHALDRMNNLLKDMGDNAPEAWRGNIAVVMNGQVKVISRTTPMK